MSRQKLARFDGSFALDPGSLRHPIAVQRRVVDATGYDIVTTWQTIWQGYAAITAMRGRELEAARQTFAEARFQIRTWYPSAPFQREDRIIWGTRILDILDVEDPQALRREVLIIAREFTE